MIDMSEVSAGRTRGDVALRALQLYMTKCDHGNPHIAVSLGQRTEPRDWSEHDEYTCHYVRTTLGR